MVCNYNRSIYIQLLEVSMGRDMMACDEIVISLNWVPDPALNDGDSLQPD